MVCDFSFDSNAKFNPYLKKIQLNILKLYEKKE